MSTTPTFSIQLANFIYNDINRRETILLNDIVQPKKCSFLDSSNHPAINGVYVIFSPEIRDFNTRGQGCIYVGEGNIKNRLYSHKYRERFGDQKNDFIVIYYEIDNQVDRRTVERILIKYYDPTYNKEGISKLNVVKQQCQINKKFSGIIKELEDIFNDRIYTGTQTYGELVQFNAVVLNLLQNSYSLEDISEEITLYQMLDAGTDNKAFEKLAEFCWLK
ncbi:GIY-YIG nuclease family protein [Bacillus mycoides]|uniref:GIY-YIG nuclease family protein n=1 Tax=Bacillus mycoides TaxID=1405 RepID=UPI003D657C40